jgi:general secretion pathway protein G
MRSARRAVWVLAVVAGLSLIGCPACCGRPSLRTREAVLRTNLRTLRDVIGQYRGDKGRRPESFEALIEAGYLRKVPIDPITHSSATWLPVYGSEGGIREVRSGAEGRGTDGRLYRDW